MNFLEECIQDSLPIWESCLNTKFLKGVADGSLPEECFKGYIVDDSLYLREYSKVFAWGMIHSRDMAEIRNYYSLLSFVNESEDATRRYYLKRYGITDEEIQPLPLRPENRAYVDSMLAAARDGEGAAECMMACLPCMLSYGWIFGELIRRSPGVENTPYWPFVRTTPATATTPSAGPGPSLPTRPAKIWHRERAKKWQGDFSAPAPSMSYISGR